MNSAAVNLQVNAHISFQIAVFVSLEYMPSSHIAKIEGIQHLGFDSDVEYSVAVLESPR